MVFDVNYNSHKLSHILLKYFKYRKLEPIINPIFSETPLGENIQIYNHLLHNLDDKNHSLSKVLYSTFFLGEGRDDRHQHKKF